MLEGAIPGILVESGVDIFQMKGYNEYKGFGIEGGLSDDYFKRNYGWSDGTFACYQKVYELELLIGDLSNQGGRSTTGGGNPTNTVSGKTTTNNKPNISNSTPITTPKSPESVLPLPYLIGSANTSPIIANPIGSLGSTYNSNGLNSYTGPSSKVDYGFDIKDYIDSRKEKIIDILKTEEKDIYRAYGFLWSVRYLLNEAKLDQISLFNYTQYPHLSNFLEKFGNSKNISKNYNKNFMDDRVKEKNDMKLVHDWIGKLNEGKLSPMAKKSAKSLKKRKKKNKVRLMIIKQLKYRVTIIIMSIIKSKIPPRK